MHGTGELFTFILPDFLPALLPPHYDVDVNITVKVAGPHPRASQETAQEARPSAELPECLPQGQYVRSQTILKGPAQQVSLLKLQSYLARLIFFWSLRIYMSKHFYDIKKVLF